MFSNFIFLISRFLNNSGGAIFLVSSFLGMSGRIFFIGNSAEKGAGMAVISGSQVKRKRERERAPCIFSYSFSGWLESTWIWAFWKQLCQQLRRRFVGGWGEHGGYVRKFGFWQFVWLRWPHATVFYLLRKRISWTTGIVCSRDAKSL